MVDFIISYNDSPGANSIPPNDIMYFPIHYHIIYSYCYHFSRLISEKLLAHYKFFIPDSELSQIALSIWVRFGNL